MSRNEMPKLKPGTDMPDGAADRDDVTQRDDVTYRDDTAGSGGAREETETGIETRATILIDPDGTVTVSHFTRDFMDIARTLDPNDRRWDKFEQ